MRLSAPIFRLKRQARLRARASGIPLHQALDGMARAEGFQSWSHLAAASGGHLPATLLAQLAPGDFVLLAARPGHGKTLLGLELAAEAARFGRVSWFFSLVEAEADLRGRIETSTTARLAVDAPLNLDVSDDISAAYVTEKLNGSEPGSVAVIDYLQVLEERRSNPSLDDQIGDLARLAADRGVVLVALSQIDRSFDARTRDRPDLSDVRLPNPADLSRFTRACFLHDGKIDLQPVT